MPVCGLSADEGRDVTANLLARYPDTTAVVAWNDLAALGALRAAEAAGRCVPRDFSIVCFNQSTISDFIPFQPTNVDIRAEELARRGMDLLIARLEGKPVEQNQVLLDPQFVIGETTARVGA